MPFQLVKADITTLRCDAIVNAANATLLGGGGVDGAIHRAAGTGLLAECRTLGGCETGQAKITRGYDLPARYVIHTVGPIWQGGAHGEETQLRSCYRRSLALAVEYGCESVAFPLVSAGAYGYPKDEALQVATEEITAFLLGHDLLVYLVLYDASIVPLDIERRADIAAYIDEKYAELPVLLGDAPAVRASGRAAFRKSRMSESKARFDEVRECAIPAEAASSLTDALGKMDESFSEMLLRKIDEKGMTDAACYKKANIDRKLFSKIRSDRLYRPSKTTALAFAIALELPLDETRDLLMKAGFALSHSNKFDIIIEYFIEHGNYNVFEINEALFAFDQALLGA